MHAPAVIEQNQQSSSKVQNSPGLPPPTHVPAVAGQGAVLMIPRVMIQTKLRRFRLNIFKSPGTRLLREIAGWINSRSESACFLPAFQYQALDLLSAAQDRSYYLSPNAALTRKI
jgi:hypothetical protein